MWALQFFDTILEVVSISIVSYIFVLFCALTYEN